MRINQETVLVGSKVILVPYRKEHVAKYHEWMSNEEIRQQTASEPLSLEEEYEMQRSWQQDDDKLTFIVLAKTQRQDSCPLDDLLRSSPMAGDVNLFLSERHDDEVDGSDEDQGIDAELEVMIAEPLYRKQGLAIEALSLLIHYASTMPIPAPSTTSQADTLLSRYLPLPRSAFLAKIGFDNDASIHLFEKLGFQEVKRSDIWKEVELRPAKEGLKLGPPIQPADVHHWALPM